MEIDKVAQHMAFDGLDKCRSTALQALKQFGATEAHQTLPRAGEADKPLGLRGCRARPQVGGDVVPQAVARQVEIIDRIDDRIRVEKGVGVAGLLIVNRKFDGARQAQREEGTSPIIEVQVLAPRGVCLRVVVLDKAARATYQKQPHQVAPIVGVLALLEGGQRAYRALVAKIKGGLAQLADEPFRANAQVFTVLVREEEAQLSRKVEIGFVIGRRRQQHTLTLVL